MPEQDDDQHEEALAGRSIDAASATTGASVMRSASWLFVSRMLPQFYVLLQSVVAARFLGPDGMGQQSFMAFVELALISTFTGGLPAAVQREVGASLGRGETGSVRVLERWAWRASLVGALLGAAVLTAIALSGRELRTAWALAAVACAVAVLHSVPSSMLTGMQKWRQATAVSLCTGTAGLVATLAVLAAGYGITGIFAVEAGVGAVNLAATWFLSRRAVAPFPRKAVIDRQLLRHVVRFAAAATLNVFVSLVVWRRSEFLFLKRYSTNADIALYSVAFGALTAANYLPHTLAAVLNPALSTLVGAQAQDRVRRGFARAVRLIALMCMAVTAGMIALGPGLIRTVYGEDYRGAGPILLILMTTFPVVSLIYISEVLLWAEGRLRLPAVALCVGAVANVTFDFVFIPHHGAVGAAGATVAAQLVTGLPVVIAALRRVRPEWVADTLVRGALGSALSGILAWLTWHLVGGVVGLLLGMIVGLVGFLGLGALLRFLSAEDAAWLDKTTGHLARGKLGLIYRAFARSSPSPTPAPAGPRGT